MSKAHRTVISAMKKFLFSDYQHYYHLSLNNDIEIFLQNFAKEKGFSYKELHDNYYHDALMLFVENVYTA